MLLARLFARSSALLLLFAGCGNEPIRIPPPDDIRHQSEARANEKSAGCKSCHGMKEDREGHGIFDDPDMHMARRHIGCADCHQGDARLAWTGAVPSDDPGFLKTMKAAHVQPRYPAEWPSSRNPERSYTLLNRESLEFIQFVNPGDLRVADRACGQCHYKEVETVRRSMMSTSAMFWGGASYNNGSLPWKRYRFGESYSPEGVPQRLQGVIDFDKEGKKVVNGPNEKELERGVLESLDPLPRWNLAQPGNVLRAFESGGRRSRANPSDVGLPRTNEDPGRPDMKLGDRGFGTQLRIDPVLLNLQKTRLNDPHLYFLGTNDHPGDYRSSGCSACHVVYANDRTPIPSGPYARYGNRGRSASQDPTLRHREKESGHPIVHRFTTSIPSSQCMTCHHHQPNGFMNTFLGYQMWDYETDARDMWDRKQQVPSEAERAAKLASNPEAAAVRGRWSDPDFLADVTKLNKDLTHTRFADYHGHGWIFREVYKRDRKGNLLDANDELLPFGDPDARARRVHLMDIHAERGMHCVDCHFVQDNHGDGRLYGEYQNAIEIACVDCHGTVDRRFAADQKTSGPAGGKTNFGDLKPPSWTLESRFQWRGEELAPLQRSMLYPGKVWEIPQVMDIVADNGRVRENPDPTSTRKNGEKWYNPSAAWAKTVRQDARTWGAVGEVDLDRLAHRSSRMECYTCHTSWTTSCFGCHLPMRANERRPMLHNEGDLGRNWTSYNPQVVRDDVFMLGRHGKAKCGRIAPVRSSSAVMISSQNANREWIYLQQAPVSAPGLSSQAFNPHFPHTVRTRETKRCDDCHVSKENDNNAWLAQVYLQGTNFVNFMGRYCYVAEGRSGCEAVVVSEREEPQAVIGSELHELAYPDDFKAHEKRGRVLSEAVHHGGTDVRSLQLRGEYLYAASGSGGFRVYDVANVDNKGFSARIVTSPVSPLGQDTHVPTKFATAVALPTTMPVHDRSKLLPKEFWKDNEEARLHPLYRYAYVTDAEEGLIVVDVMPLADGDPRNNFLDRALTWNPKTGHDGKPLPDGRGLLDGATNLTVAGARAYVCTPRGLVVVNLEKPLEPSPEMVLGPPGIVEPRAVAVQFRYAFVVDAEGLKVVDITFSGSPALTGVKVPMNEAQDIYVARTYAYIAAGPRGLAIIDVEKPENPRLLQYYDLDGKLNDTRSVRVATTNASLFAYVADGRNGLRVLQLTSPRMTPGHYGFSPPPTPRLIATYPTRGPALALSKPLDRDRAVDETGNQVSVFGRLGSGPLKPDEVRRLYLRPDGTVFRPEPSGDPAHRLK